MKSQKRYQVCRFLGYPSHRNLGIYAPSGHPLQEEVQNQKLDDFHILLDNGLLELEFPMCKKARIVHIPIFFVERLANPVIDIYLSHAEHE